MSIESKYTREFYTLVDKIRKELHYGTDGRFNQIVLGVKDSLQNPHIITACQILFEDYKCIRVCTRLLIKILI